MTYKNTGNPEFQEILEFLRTALGMKWSEAFRQEICEAFSLQKMERKFSSLGKNKAFVTVFLQKLAGGA